MDVQREDEFRIPFSKTKSNNYLYKPMNDENDGRISNSKLHISKHVEKDKIQTLKNENRKLIWMLENSEKVMKNKLKESQKQIDKIMSVIRKFWKIIQKQILDPYQRRFYFDKNSPEEINMKKLLKENEYFRSKKENSGPLLENLGMILDICCTKLSVKQESDKQIYKKWTYLENDLRSSREKQTKFKKMLHQNESIMVQQNRTINKLSQRIDELEAFRLLTLDSTVNKLANEEELIHKIKDAASIKKNSMLNPNENQDLPTFGGMSFSQDLENKNGQNSWINIKPSDLIKDIDIVPGSMKAITNEVLYLFNDEEKRVVNPLIKTIKGGSKPLDPKVPQSPAFYTSSDLLENSNFQIASSKTPSSNESKKNKPSISSSVLSDINMSCANTQDFSKNKYKR